jgi:hypothetical protein
MITSAQSKFSSRNAIYRISTTSFPAKRNNALNLFESILRTESVLSRTGVFCKPPKCGAVSFIKLSFNNTSDISHPTLKVRNLLALV